MNPETPTPVVDEKLAQTALGQKVETAINLFHPSELSEENAASDSYLPRPAKVFDQASQLEVRSKAALIRRLLTHLEADQIQAILEFGQRELAERQRGAIAAALVNRNTRLLLKKDYTYQTRGLSQPTQYYVYLRRRKPKLDRYIGTLFYINEGCTLSYCPDPEGRILFNPPHNVFRLTDSKDASVVQVVRLIGLEPPPPEYTFTKQQEDTPEIFLRLEYLDPNTYEPVTEETFPFPLCMYEGGKLDRYRWDVTTVIFPSERLDRPLPTADQPAPKAQPAELSQPASTPTVSPSAVSKPRRVIELPPTSSTFYLANRCDAARVLERMRLWVAWSEKAMPQSRWEVIQDGAIYTLSNASFKRNILSFSLDQASITLDNSLPVLMKWFHDLGLAVSQAQSQRQYSSAQLKLAHTLVVDMSLPQNEPLVVLKKLFGVGFSKTSLYK